MENRLCKMKTVAEVEEVRRVASGWSRREAGGRCLPVTGRRYSKGQPWTPARRRVSFRQKAPAVHTLEDSAESKLSGPDWRVCEEDGVNNPNLSFISINLGSRGTSPSLSRRGKVTAGSWDRAVSHTAIPDEVNGQDVTSHASGSCLSSAAPQMEPLQDPGPCYCSLCTDEHIFRSSHVHNTRGPKPLDRKSGYTPGLTTLPEAEDRSGDLPYQDRLRYSDGNLGAEDGRKLDNGGNSSRPARGPHCPPQTNRTGQQQTTSRPHCQVSRSAHSPPERPSKHQLWCGQPAGWWPRVGGRQVVWAVSLLLLLLLPTLTPAQAGKEAGADL